MGEQSRLSTWPDVSVLRTKINTRKPLLQPHITTCHVRTVTDSLATAEEEKGTMIMKVE
jgi:hypothetical protein